MKHLLLILPLIAGSARLSTSVYDSTNSFVKIKPSEREVYGVGLSIGDYKGILFNDNSIYVGKSIHF